MINPNATFDKHCTARLGEYTEDDNALELFRRRGDVYDLTIYWRNDDISFGLSRAELKALGHALVRLADVQFIDGEP